MTPTQPAWGFSRSARWAGVEHLDAGTARRRRAASPGSQRRRRPAALLTVTRLDSTGLA